MIDHCEDTIKSVMAHMGCLEAVAIGMLDCCNDQEEIDAIAGVEPYERDEYQEWVDRKLTGDDQ
jgi:hypothetical protein